MAESLKGRLLVAVPGANDPNFDRTVVLVLEHGEPGALGLVLNRPTDTPLGEILPAWESRAAPPGVVFRGGPVAPSGAIGLARAPDGSEADGWVGIGHGLGTVDLARDPGDLVTPVEHVRVFAGHAGWAPSQLESEVAADGWFVVDAVPDDAMTSDPSALWAVVLRRQGPRYEMFANFPADPSAN